MVEFKKIDDINFPFEVGVLPQKEMALKFADYLNSIGVKATAMPGFGANYAVYVAYEKDVSKAKLELLRFGNNPFAKAYNQAAWQQGRTIKREKSFNSNFLSFSMGSYMWTPFSLTSIMEILCLAIFLLSLLPSFEALLLQAFTWTSLSSITEGFEIYRIITPIFLHFGFIHIAFNLVMFEVFARPIERYFGAFKLAYIMLLIALVSNTLQFIFLQGNSIFGGLSGIVYGLIGYMGILSRRQDLPSSLRIPQGLLLVSFIFVALGFFLSGIAALCHLGGILVGIALGFIDFKRPLRQKF